MTPRIAAAVMALVIAKRESWYHIAGFTKRMVDLGLTASDSIDSAVQKGEPCRLRQHGLCEADVGRDEEGDAGGRLRGADG